MKNFKFFLPFAALGLLASCSNDNVVDPTPDPVPDAGDMYMTVNVSLPNSAGTKASLQGYDDAIEAEYNVYNMKLYVFYDENGSTDPETNATFVKSLSIGFKDGETTGLPSDVQLQKQAVFQVDNTTFDLDASGNPKKGKYYGLLVVNQPTNATAWPEPTTTYAEWNKTILNAANTSDIATTLMMPELETGKAYFTMTNAPYENENEKVTVLEEIKTENFTTSPTPASVAAANFYVQRGVAKVKVTATNFAEITANHSTSDKVKIEKWALDVTNKVSFPVQNVDGFSTWKTYGTYFYNKPTGVTDGLTHIWWGTDPNYDGTGDYTDAFITLPSNTSTLSLGTSDAAYCLENTMDQSHMIKNQTTRVVLQATYLVDGEALKDGEAGMIVFNDKAYVVKTTDLNSNPTPEEGKTNEYKLSALITATSRGDIKSALMMGSDSDVVTYYPGNKTFYVAYIRHFDNDETPLTKDEGAEINPDVDLFNMTTNDYTEKHLGRYGVLRNNSYQVNIIAVNGFGSPTVPPPGNTPDDKNDNKQYNALVNINILKWAKRTYDYVPR